MAHTVRCCLAPDTRESRYYMLFSARVAEFSGDLRMSQQQGLMIPSLSAFYRERDAVQSTTCSGPASTQMHTFGASIVVCALGIVKHAHAASVLLSIGRLGRAGLCRAQAPAEGLLTLSC